MLQKLVQDYKKAPALPLDPDREVITVIIGYGYSFASMVNQTFNFYITTLNMHSDENFLISTNVHIFRWLL